MLLRIDVYPFDGATQKDVLGSPSSTLYACLATASSDDGQLVTVGRKKGDIRLPEDKSVSRDHCSLRLVSANKTHNIQQPQTPEQTEACQDSIDHMCVVFENKGKLGSFIVEEETSGSRNTKGDDSDSDTDEEEAVMQSQMSIGVPLSNVTQKLGSAQAHLKAVGPDQSLVLKGLCKTTNETSQQQRVIVQVGKLGSTLVITRETLRIVRSGSDKKITAAWKPRYHAIGVEEMSHVDSTTTHVVTSSFTPNVKQLTAWCLGIPLVTIDYLQALLDRSQPTDPLPDPKEFAPKSDSHSFWNTQANPKLWSSCTLLSIKQDDTERLVQAVGASVVPLYDLPEPEALQKARDVLEDNDSSSQKSCFCMHEARRKLTRQLKEMGVPVVTPKGLAECITKQELLKDNKGNVIGTPHQETLVEKKGDKDDDDVAAQDETRPVSPHVETPVVPKGDDDSNRTKSVRTEEPSETKGRPKKRDKQTEKDKEESVPSETAETMQQEIVEERPKKRDKPSNESRNETKEDTDEEPPTKRKKSVTNEAEKETQEPLQPSDTNQRKQLEVNRSGWLAAAPKGKKRSDYIRPKDEIQEKAGYEELVEVAPTDRCKGLIVQKNVSAPRPSGKQSKKAASGPNFKRFRKNSVAQSRVLPRIKFRLVLPKETEQHREFEEQRQALEEQQRKADELFRDPVRTAATRRRRR